MPIVALHVRTHVCMNRLCSAWARQASSLLWLTRKVGNSNKACGALAGLKCQYMSPIHRAPISMRLANPGKIRCDLIGHVKARTFTRPGTGEKGLSASLRILLSNVMDACTATYNCFRLL